MIIELFGYYGCPLDTTSRAFVIQESIHEFCHAFVNLLSRYLNNHIFKKGDVLISNHLGLISLRDPRTNQLIAPRFYGKFFNEKMMDIITAIIINLFCKEQSLSNYRVAKYNEWMSFYFSDARYSIDQILKTHSNTCGTIQNLYNKFTPITRLAIAAFSNNGYIQYQDLFEHIQPIFQMTPQLPTEELQKCNDFLYGITFDPMHIDKMFDMVMGTSEYRKFCQTLDLFFYKSIDIEFPEFIRTQKGNLTNFMDILAKFLDKKMALYIQNGLISQSEADQIVLNFNNVLQSVNAEYHTNYTYNFTYKGQPSLRRKP